jgi:signal transduction histidine kinase
MLQKDAADIELENTVRRLLESAAGASAQAASALPEHKQVLVSQPAGTEKIAHDLRASLNIIIGFTELMLDEVTGKISAEQRRCLTDVLNNGKRLMDLSENIIKQLEKAGENSR